MLTFHQANQTHFDIITQHDTHIPPNIIKDKISRGEIYVAYENENFAGWIRYGLFWDSIPFMNMLFLLPEYRGKGLGRKFVEAWEQDLKTKGYNKILTSTQQNEHAQHFYLAMGYVAVGGFIQTSGAVTDESFEIILTKNL